MPAKKEHFCARCGAGIDIAGEMGRVTVQTQKPEFWALACGGAAEGLTRRNVAPQTKLCVECAIECQHVIDEWVAKGEGTNRD